MQKLSARQFVLLVAILAAVPCLVVLGQSAGSKPVAPARVSAPTRAGAGTGQPFDPRDLSGAWRGDRVPGLRNWASFDQTLPEPPLTPWARQHLLYASISHDALSGKRIRMDSPGHPCPDNKDPCYSEDLYGVPVNRPDGEYPAKDCEPLSTPAAYDYPDAGSMELFTTRDGGRIFQMFEYHREWRTFWMNREHPKDLDPTYEGHSVARWEGNTLVVDTTGYNDKTMVTQNVAHRKSEAFRLEERIHLVDRDHLRIDMTYYDPLAWGDKSWPGFFVNYKRVAKEDFIEFICSPREYMEYEAFIASPGASKK